MMNFTDLITLSTVVIAIAVSAQLINKSKPVFNLGLIAVGASLLFFTKTMPATATPDLHFAALAATDSMSREQDALEENLKLAPGGGHYTGLEYPETINPKKSPLDDQGIQNKVESMSDSKVIVAVTNGSVRLTGRAKDKYSAHDLVENVKEIPGVREITFDFSLEDIK
ncbi:conserved hypothetical protein [Gloeothece citriformis PCC 7424]|uniref:BON domain-containing protein n=1 Tax=Gloeothece citriformis (strain PCC 7424) TaxID=65393 RepID=B7KCK4_GLOC7|nr:BON domain-containing protein [Gloeothece citriformis]ACK71555.1 conserved hypothetical protein [Gloeothece citriformis PCC 7424]